MAEQMPASAKSGDLERVKSLVDFEVPQRAEGCAPERKSLFNADAPPNATARTRRKRSRKGGSRTAGRTSRRNCARRIANAMDGQAHQG